MYSLFFADSISTLLASVLIAMIHSVIYYVSYYLSIMHVVYLIPEGGTMITSTFQRSKQALRDQVTCLCSYSKWQNLSSTQAIGLWKCPLVLPSKLDHQWLRGKHSSYRHRNKQPHLHTSHGFNLKLVHKPSWRPLWERVILISSLPRNSRPPKDTAFLDRKCTSFWSVKTCWLV